MNRIYESVSKLKEGINLSDDEFKELIEFDGNADFLTTAADKIRKKSMEAMFLSVVLLNLQTTAKMTAITVEFGAAIHQRSVIG